jgi:hypothetical protein
MQLNYDSNEGSGQAPQVPDDSGTDVARRLVEDYTQAFNERDTEAVLSRFHPAIVLSPSKLSARERRYYGHEGARKWFDEVRANPIPYRAGVNEIRRMDSDRLMVLGEVIVDDEALCPYVLTIRVADELIVEMTSYLTDEETLRHLDRLG